MEQVVENILALVMEAKIMTVTSQVETLQNKVDAMAKSFDTMQDNGEKWKEVVGRKVDKVANKVDRATDADLVKAREANIRVTGLTVATPLWPSVGVKPNTSKVGNLESFGTPECLEFDRKAQNTSHWGVFGVIKKGLEA
jgi:hypothetical protein